MAIFISMAFLCESHSNVIFHSHADLYPGLVRRQRGDLQWRRQRNEGARSFRSQKILEPGQVTRCPGG